MTVSRRALTLAGLMAVALLATGCAVQLPGAAGVVGEVRVSDAALDDAVTQTQAALVQYKKTPVAPATLTHQNLSRMVTSELLAVAAQRRNIVVTPGQVDREIAVAERQAGADNLRAQLAANRGVPPLALNSFARDFFIEQVLRDQLLPGGGTDAQAVALQNYLGALSRELDTRISPRFGTWDATQLAIGPVPTNLASFAAVPVSASPSGLPTPVTP